ENNSNNSNCNGIPPLPSTILLCSYQHASTLNQCIFHNSHYQQLLTQVCKDTINNGSNRKGCQICILYDHKGNDGIIDDEHYEEAQDATAGGNHMSKRRQHLMTTI